LATDEGRYQGEVLLDRSGRGVIRRRSEGFFLLPRGGTSTRGKGGSDRVNAFLGENRRYNGVLGNFGREADGSYLESRGGSKRAKGSLRRSPRNTQERTSNRGKVFFQSCLLPGGIAFLPKRGKEKGSTGFAGGKKGNIFYAYGKRNGRMRSLPLPSKNARGVK